MFQTHSHGKQGAFSNSGLRWGISPIPRFIHSGSAWICYKNILPAHLSIANGHPLIDQRRSGSGRIGLCFGVGQYSQQFQHKVEFLEEDAVKKVTKNPTQHSFDRTLQKTLT